MLTKILVAIPSVILGFLLLIQIVPYGRGHTNPPDTGEPKWDSPRTRELVVQACYDCHSNQTVWPWYSNIAPTSWLVYHDVTDARSYLNFTDWARKDNAGKEAADKVRAKEMPKPPFPVMHPEARLSDSERDELIRGLEATFGKK
jgi:hypothetical protein